MPRSLSPTFLTQLASSGASMPVLFAVLAFANETLYLYGGLGPLTPAGPPYNPLSKFPYGQTFTGLGWLAKMSAIPQTTKVQAQSITLSLSGIPNELVLDSIGQVRITGTAQVFLGFFNSSGALIPDPVQLFSGALDVPTLDDSGETSTISITAENPLLSLNLAPNRQFDDMDQQIYHPGDLGFAAMAALGNTPLFWPAPGNAGSPWPVSFVMSPQGYDVAVGGSFVMSATINYSDGSSYTKPAGTGSGPHWVGGISSSNPAIATVDNSGNVVGRSPGSCLIITRSPLFDSTGNVSSERRVATPVFVHN